MSLYTSIYFTPIDRGWIAPPELVRGITALLEVPTFDFFSVYREVSSDPALDEDDRYDQILSKRNLPVNDGILLLRADPGYWTHMMFASGDFMKDLMAEVTAAIPESLARGFAPCDASFYSGHWAIWSYEDSTLADSGSCALQMSYHGCPTDLNSYLERFLDVEGVKQFQRRLEALSNQQWTAVINLT